MSESGEKEENMDRNFGRQTSVPSKGNGTESKKDNGNSNNGQKFPRSNRRRDPGNRNNNDQVSGRRPQPQKSRSMDKRPRPRGFSNGNTRDEMTQMERSDQYGSVHNWGSKKGNLSHLLNFHFEPRELYGRGNDRGYRPQNDFRPKGRGGRYRGSGTKYNKEHFLQANCQFIVRENGDYAVHTADPDILVDWDLIEQVRLFGHGVPSCPICLYPPTTAKMTRCGHIYCWSCILHYLSLGEKPWRRCPICYDAIQQIELKSVKALDTHSYVAGEQITLQLMKRKRDSIQYMPVKQWEDREGKLYSMMDTVDTQYAKLLLAPLSEIQKILDQEKQDLQRQLEEDGSETLESSYVEAALKLLHERQGSLSFTATVKQDVVEELKKLQIQEENEVKEATKSLELTAKNTVVYSSAFSDDEELDEMTHVSPTLLRTESWCGLPPEVSDTSDAFHKSQSWTEPDHELRDGVLIDDQAPVDTVTMVTEELVASASEGLSSPQIVGASGGHRRVEYYYFYQAADGQHIYLDSINARCLVREYGSLENSPPTVTANIVHLDSVTMNEDLRHRLRYLGHMPVTCEFQVVELALKPPLVSKETLKFFSAEIERKRRLRQKKNREEKRFDRRIDRIHEQEHRKMGIDKSAVFVPSALVEPQIVPSAMIGQQDSTESTPCGSPTVSSSTELLATSPKSTVGSDDGGQTWSFAEMLKTGKAKPQEVWPKSSTNEPTGPEKPRPRGSDSESDNEDRTPVPVYKASFGDAIQKALDKYKTPGQQMQVELGSLHAETTPGKKKKKQKTLLFTTTMARAK